jgi:8-oxo-dGTP pyrophosphatase MutT (NUDIX family)
MIKPMAKIFSEEENKKWQRTLPMKMSSACVVLKSGDEVLVVKAHYKDHWTFPSGIVDENESPMAAAIRETYEEIGVKLDSGQVKSLAVIYSQGKDGYLDRFNFVFIVEDFEKDTLLSLQKEEVEEAKWIAVHEIAQHSNNKGSYVNIQRLLANGIHSEHYIEVL